MVHYFWMFLHIGGLFFSPLMGSGVEPCRRQCRLAGTAGYQVAEHHWTVEFAPNNKKKAPVFASDALVSVVLYVYMLSAHS